MTSDHGISAPLSKNLTSSFPFGSLYCFLTTFFLFLPIQTLVDQNFFHVRPQFRRTKVPLHQPMLPAHEHHHLRTYSPATERTLPSSKLLLRSPLPMILPFRPSRSGCGRSEPSRASYFPSSTSSLGTARNLFPLRRSRLRLRWSHLATSWPPRLPIEFSSKGRNGNSL